MKKRYLCMSKRKKPSKIKTHRVSHGGTLLQIKWLIPMTMPCIWICIWRCCTLTHTQIHIHKPIYAWTTNKKAYSIQFFPLDFSGRLGKKGWKPNRDLRRWVIVNINRTRHVFVYSFDRTRSVCIGLLNTATNAPWSLDMQIRLPLELMNFQCNLRVLIREWRLLFKSMNRFI